MRYEFLNYQDGVITWPSTSLAEVTPDFLYYMNMTIRDGAIYNQDGSTFAYIIKRNSMLDLLIISRPTVLGRAYYQLLSNVLESASLTKSYLIRLLEIWGLASTPQAMYHTWRDIYFIGYVYNWLHKEKV